MFYKLHYYSWPHRYPFLLVWKSLNFPLKIKNKIVSRKINTGNSNHKTRHFSPLPNLDGLRNASFLTVKCFLQENNDIQCHSYLSIMVCASYMWMFPAWSSLSKCYNFIDGQKSTPAYPHSFDFLHSILPL